MRDVSVDAREEMDKLLRMRENISKVKGVGLTKHGAACVECTLHGNS